MRFNHVPTLEPWSGRRTYVTGSVVDTPKNVLRVNTIHISANSTTELGYYHDLAVTKVGLQKYKQICEKAHFFQRWNGSPEVVAKAHSALYASKQNDLELGHL